MVLAKELKKGNFVLVDDQPYKVMGYKKSKTGRHGSAKYQIELVGIIDGKKKLIFRPGTASLEAPNIDKRTAQVISISDDSVQLMDMQDYETFDLAIPEEMKGKLESGKEVAYWKIDGKKFLMTMK
ncbi:MAG: translation initiation factor IF-5A [Candidatus Aenigmarchaeota archaeon]|nr:translation initiation factor IF-5A [Candidatus Aenigmarchaeota archaeon]